ncbi:L-rhamnose/proton symporter RhaT [Neolewinella agarilytica]|uniref:L-rhamnose-H+ transport protein n=1 Tax=Neolewinella agarilytica TaxID=478744 RepID=A0A1H9KN18_9BACT|nr:L-rhamnose/proton symporter RhaT [Neolewinella agarilytica]SER00307.1 L-rhamnose-H+ transport protein [Neolewinella agarilytica]
MEASFPFILVLIASVFQGSFGVGMKHMEPLKWEAWWLLHATVAMIVFPLSWALLVVPDLFGIIAAAPSEAIWTGMLYGFLWGIGGILFGKSIPYIGISLTYGIVMGVCSAVGCLIPFFQLEEVTGMAAFPYVIGGVLLMLIGVAITAYAGVKRDRLLKQEVDGGSNLKAGLVIALLSGVLSALLNVGFVSAQPVGEIAAEAGVITRNTSLAVWVVVLLGAYLMNAGYAIFLLFKNKSWASFSVAGSGKAYSWSVAAGLLWFGALGVYGQGATLMGDIGPVIGWPILLGVSLIVSNIWAYLNKEWDGAKGPFMTLLFGLLILIVATIVLGYSNGLS